MPQRTRPYTANAEDLEVIEDDELEVMADEPRSAPSMGGSPRGQGMPILTGIAKGLGNTVFGLGKIVHDYTPIGYISEAIHPHSFDQRPPELQPQGGLEGLGYGVEQLAEFLALPTGKGGLIRQGATQGVGSGALTGIQGGTTGDVAKSAGISAVAPPAAAVVARTAPAAAQFLKDSALKNVSQAFSATGKAMKRDVEKIAPRVIDEGITAATRPGLVRKAESKLDELGAQYDEAQAALPQGDRLPTEDVRASIRASMDSLVERGSSGKPVPRNPQKYKALQELDETVGELGDLVSRESLQAFKGEWDDIVAKAGGYSDKTGDALSQAQKWAYREGAGAIRRVLAQDSPRIDALNAEWSFWTKVRDVSEESVSRTRPHKGFMSILLGGVGAGAGATGGGDPVDRVQNAVIGGALGSQAIRLMQSPGWKLVSAQLKTKLADALMSANPERVSTAVGRITAAMQTQPALAQ